MAAADADAIRQAAQAATSAPDRRRQSIRDRDTLGASSKSATSGASGDDAPSGGLQLDETEALPGEPSGGLRRSAPRGSAALPFRGASPESLYLLLAVRAKHLS